MPRVLITGGAGYVGSQLIRKLSSRDGTAVRVIDNLQREGYRALMGLREAPLEFVEGDLLDPASMGRALREVDAVIHLAAVVSTPLSFEHARWTEQVNHWGTARLVEACLDAEIERLIFTSSASVYGPAEGVNEREACRPVGPYASSKFAAERAISAAASRGLLPTILRLGTVFGAAPVARFDAMPNRLAYLAGTGRSLTVYGSGDQQRALLDVEDACSAILFCLDRQEETTGATFNVLTANASVLDVVQSIRQVRPEARATLTEQDVRTHLSYSMDGSRLQDLGWQPTDGIDSGIEGVVKLFEGIETPSIGRSPLDVVDG